MLSLLILDPALWSRPPRAKPPRLSDWVGSCAPRTLIKIDQATPPRDKIKLIQGQSSLIKARQGFPKNRESSLDIKPSPFSQYPFPSVICSGEESHPWFSRLVKNHITKSAGLIRKIRSLVFKDLRIPVSLISLSKEIKMKVPAKLINKEIPQHWLATKGYGRLRKATEGHGR